MGLMVTPAVMLMMSPQCKPLIAVCMSAPVFTVQVLPLRAGVALSAVYIQAWGRAATSSAAPNEGVLPGPQ